MSIRIGGQVSRKRRVGILGGSFDPPHRGHVAICEKILKEKQAGEVWMIPCYKHPFDKPLVPFEHRLKMCRLVFSRKKRVRVLDIEGRMKGTSYTLRTLKVLMRRHPSVCFLLILGQDAAREVKKWRGFDELKTKVDWIIVPRGPRSPIPDIRATKIRQSIADGEDVGDWLADEVIKYIAKNGLYRVDGIR